jgi:hypothetical protein
MNALCVVLDPHEGIGTCPLQVVMNLAEQSKIIEVAAEVLLKE